MSERRSRARLLGALLRLYRIALRALPGAERDRFGASMEADARRLVGEALAERGRLAAVWAGLRESADVAGTGLSARGRGTMGGWGMDLRYSIRSLAARPGFALVAAVTLGVAIGACTTVYSVVDGVLLRALPYPEPERLVRLIGTYRGGREVPTVSYLDARDVGEASRTLSGVAIYRGWSATLTGLGEPERIDGLMASHGFLEMLGIEPALGRRFLPEEDADGSDRVVILAYGFWQRRFGGDPDIVGRTLDLNGNAHVVVGVGPESFARELPAFASFDLLRPLGWGGVAESDLPSRGNESYWAVARMTPGVSRAQVDDELAAVMKGIEEENPGSNTGQSMRVRQVQELATGNARATLLTFLGAVAFVLAVGIANVAGLFLGRAVEREHEVALRAALGAGRARIVRQLLVESTLVAGAGVILGAILALAGTDLVVARAGGTIPLASEIRVDGSVLGLAALAGLASALVTGLVPGLSAVGHDLLGSLRDGARRNASESGGRVRLRRGLLVAQIALSVLLVVGAGLLLRSYVALSGVETGLRDDMLTFRLDPFGDAYDTDEDFALYYASVEERLRALPGVDDIAFVTGVPMTGRQACGTLYGLDDPTRFDGQDLCAEVRAISPNYFEVTGLPVLEGRAFDADDTAESDDVVIINEVVAELLWPGADPLGRELATGLGGRTHRVVGVVPPVKQFNLDEPAPPQTYLPLPQWPRTGRNGIVRSTGDALALAPAVRAGVWEVDGNIPVTEIGTVAQFARETLARPRFRTQLISVFAVVALLMSLAGVYAVVSYSVTRRRREMAIRLSLGAEREAVISSVVGTGLRDAIAGVALGLLGAVALSRGLESMLYEVSPVDPLAFGATGALVLAVSTVASLVPALRVTRVDPVETLRGD